MDSTGHNSDGERQRYEKILAKLNELVTLLIAFDICDGAGFVDQSDELDLLVETITALVDDAIELGSRSPKPPYLDPAVTSTPSRPLQLGVSPEEETTIIDRPAAELESRLGEAISDAMQACKELCSQSCPDLKLLYRIKGALDTISDCHYKLRRVNSRSIPAPVGMRSVDPPAHSGATRVRAPGPRPSLSVSMLGRQQGSPRVDDMRKDSRSPRGGMSR